MIFLTKLDGREIMLNERHIESASETPDTVLIMTNGHSYIVRESMKEIRDRIVEFNRHSRRRPRRTEQPEEPLT